MAPPRARSSARSPTSPGWKVDTSVGSRSTRTTRSSTSRGACPARSSTTSNGSLCGASLCGSRLRLAPGTLRPAGSGRRQGAPPGRRASEPEHPDPIGRPPRERSRRPASSKNADTSQQTKAARAGERPSVVRLERRRIGSVHPASHAPRPADSGRPRDRDRLSTGISGPEVGSTQAVVADPTGEHGLRNETIGRRPDREASESALIAEFVRDSQHP